MSGTDDGAMIAGTTGAIVRRGRLTVVIGDPGRAFDADDSLPQATRAAVESLAQDEAWTFEAVAAALHQLVVDYNPPGVAAFLDLDEDPMVFLFDRGEATELDEEASPDAGGHTSHEADGRSGWTTKIVIGPQVRLQLRGAPAPGGWAFLRDGAVAGAAALTHVSTAAEEEVAAPEVAPPPAAPPAPPPTADGLRPDRGPAARIGSASGPRGGPGPVVVTVRRAGRRRRVGGPGRSRIRCGRPRRRRAGLVQRGRQRRPARPQRRRRRGCLGRRW